MRSGAALTAACVMLVIVAAADGGAASTPSADSTVPGVVLMRMKRDPLTGSQIVGLAENVEVFAHARSMRYDPSLDLWQLRFPPESGGAEIARLRTSSWVALAQPSFVYTNAVTPDDPLYTEQQHPYYRAVNLPAVWDTGLALQDVIVAVVDGGVDIDHPELTGRIWSNPAEFVNGQDDDGNGCIDDVHGCSFQSTSPDGAITDLDGHGTFVSGIIAAATGNGEGVAGVAPNASIMPVRALDEHGIGTTEQLAAAILYAARSGARVINLSLILEPEIGICPTDNLIQDVLRAAHDEYGATVVAAAGNFNLPCVGFPASSQDAVAVSASGPSSHTDIRAFFSHWGPEVDVTAPGIDLVSTCPQPTATPTQYCPGEAYGTGSGTSFSAPVVSGVAALVLGQNPWLTNDEVLARLKDTARDLPDDTHPNWDGAGMVDAAAALGLGSAFVTLEAVAADISSLGLSLRAGACSAPLWRHADVHSETLEATFGVAECAAQWPPSAANPWVLEGSTDDAKAARLNGLAARSIDEECSTESGGMIQVSPGEIARITCTRVQTVPNDSASSARVIAAGSIPSRFTQELRYARSDDDPNPSCVNNSSRGVWYRLEPSESRALSVDTFGSQFDTVLAVYTGAPSALTEVACNDDFGLDVSRLVLSLTGGQTYYVLATAYQMVSAGALHVAFNSVTVPSNDARSTAFQLDPGGSMALQPAHAATSDPSDPSISCVLGYGSSLWFALSTSLGEVIDVSTEGSDFDTVLAVFGRRGDGSLEEVACNEDAVPGIQTSVVSWEADGSTYFVVAGSFFRKPGGALRIRAVSR